MVARHRGITMETEGATGCEREGSAAISCTCKSLQRTKPALHSTHAEAPHEWALRMSQPSLVDPGGDRHLVEKGVAVCKAFLQDQWYKWWGEQLHEPAGLQYSCDCTSLTTQQSYRRSFGGILSVCRRGNQMHEYFIHRAFALGAQGAPCCLWSKPDSVSDNTVTAHFKISRRLLNTPAAYGHTCASLMHVIADRSVHACLTSVYHQQNIMALEQESSTLPPGLRRYVRFEAGELRLVVQSTMHMATCVGAEALA
jgi:hypothetical protein